MTHLLPPLNSLRAFEAAARHLSFKLAAHELHVTPGAISQHVKTLEERLGLQLFDRLHRQLVLTQAGLSYLTPVREAFGRLAEATSALKPDGVISVLNVGLHGGFEFERLRAELQRFRTSQSSVGVRISQPAGLRELLEGKVDVAIDRCLGHHPGYRFDRLGGGGRSEAGDYLICPEGSAECPEVEMLRSWLLADAAATVANVNDTRKRARAG
jgi:LysR family glycine cleavage system transcriptional activator